MLEAPLIRLISSPVTDHGEEQYRPVEIAVNIGVEDPMSIVDERDIFKLVWHQQ